MMESSALVEKGPGLGVSVKRKWVNLSSVHQSQPRAWLLYCLLHCLPHWERLGCRSPLHAEPSWPLGSNAGGGVEEGGEGWEGYAKKKKMMKESESGDVKSSQLELQRRFSASSS